MKKNYLFFVGFTLIEVLICLTLLGVFIGMSVPLYHRFIEKEQSESIKNNLMAIMLYAKRESILNHHAIMMCPVNNQNECSGDWSSRIVVKQINNNRIMLLRSLYIKSGHLQARTYPEDRAYILFSANALRTSTNGTFWYCVNKQPQWAIVLNKVAHIRDIYPDEKGVLKVNNKILNCDE